MFALPRSLFTVSLWATDCQSFLTFHSFLTERGNYPFRVLDFSKFLYNAFLYFHKYGQTKKSRHKFFFLHHEPTLCLPYSHISLILLNFSCDASVTLSPSHCKTHFDDLHTDLLSPFYYLSKWRYIQLL